VLRQLLLKSRNLNGPKSYSPFRPAQGSEGRSVLPDCVPRCGRGTSQLPELFL
jgi:hypothetical protein